MRFVHGPVVADDSPAMDLAVSHALLRRVSRGEVPTTLRVHRPRRPMVVFGRRDTHRPGFAAAVQVCRDAGFGPAVRGTGGRAVAYTGSALVLDQVTADPAAAEQMQVRFQEYGDRIAAVLRGIGVDARVGEVPGEYCPGAQSVNARGTVKLVGTAQRVVRDAWMFSSVVILDDAEVLAPLLAAVYQRLDLPFDPVSVGSVRAEAPDHDGDDLEKALLTGYAAGVPLTSEPLDPETLALARQLLPDHQP
ncbi:lipoate--protein ligase family protein [Micromonosporaceae bacterium Da 78-11]